MACGGGREHVGAWRASSSVSEFERREGEVAAAELLR